MRLLFVIFALFASRPVLATEPALIGNTRELRAALSSPDADGTPFRLEAQLTLGCPPGIPALSISDASGAVIVHKDQRVSSFTANAGDIIRVSGLIRRDGSKKPAFEALDQRINHDWHTEVEVMTDENGTCELTGFRGEYELSALGRSARLTLSKDTPTLTVTL